jgi:hypothetical protein
VRVAIQKESVQEVIARCQQIKLKSVTGGPLFTDCYEDFDEVDQLAQGEAELSLLQFPEELRKGEAGQLLCRQPLLISLFLFIASRNYGCKLISGSRKAKSNFEKTLSTALKTRHKHTSACSKERTSANSWFVSPTTD